MVTFVSIPPTLALVRSHSRVKDGETRRREAGSRTLKNSYHPHGTFAFVRDVLYANFFKRFMAEPYCQIFFTMIRNLNA